ncbi:MAG: type II toxin-antitoxin system RelE/ParE family toxin [Dehalococcoidia bacterium]|nr:type II toxin-antitoxin system RelE/ParE family toxin [Dehalococcoidia bacterium]
MSRTSVCTVGTKRALSAESPRAIWFLDAAEDDIAAAFEWYESKSAGLGAEFVQAVDVALASLLDFPESCEIFYRDTRRCLMGRFPFEIFYRIENGLLVIVACMHAARDLGAVRRRIRS